MNIRAVTLSQQSFGNTNNLHRLTSVPNCTFKQNPVKFEERYSDFKTMATPFEQESCKPTQNYLNYVARFFHALTIKNRYDSVKPGIDNILKVLDMHSQNQEYTDFVKEGLNFLKEKNDHASLYCLYCGGNMVLDRGGFDTYYTIRKAFEDAVMPDSQYSYKPEIMQEYIKKAREFMTAYSKEGIRLYPRGFIK